MTPASDQAVYRERQQPRSQAGLTMRGDQLVGMLVGDDRGDIRHRHDRQRGREPDDQSVTAAPREARRSVGGCQVTLSPRSATVSAVIAWSRVSRDDPRAVAVGRGVFAKPGGGHDAVAGLQGHHLVGDVNGHSGPLVGWGGRKASDKPSDDPGQRQTERDVLRHLKRSHLR